MGGGGLYLFWQFGVSSAEENSLFQAVIQTARCKYLYTSKFL